MPFRVIRELWDRHVTAGTGSVDPRLLRWWVPWDAQVALLYVMLFVGISQRTVGDAIAFQALGIAGELLFLVCTVPAISVVRTLTQAVAASVPEPEAALVEAIPLRPDRDASAVQ